MDKDNRYDDWKEQDIIKYIDENASVFTNQFHAANWLIGTFKDLDRVTALKLYRDYTNDLHGLWEGYNE